jgi:hypothetical protein
MKLIILNKLHTTNHFLTQGNKNLLFVQLLKFAFMSKGFTLIALLPHNCVDGPIEFFIGRFEADLPPTDPNTFRFTAHGRLFSYICHPGVRGITNEAVAGGSIKNEPFDVQYRSETFNRDLAAACEITGYLVTRLNLALKDALKLDQVTYIDEEADDDDINKILVMRNGVTEIVTL